MDGFTLVRLVVGAGFLAVAAALDVRTRRVRDPLWVALGTIGLLVFTVEVALSYWYWNDWLFLLSTALLFYAVFYGKPILDEDGVHLQPIRLLWLGTSAAAFVAAVFLPNPYTTYLPPAGAVVLPEWEIATVPVMVLVYQVFYQVGALRGGADAKAVIALTLLVPLTPDVTPFPLIQVPPTVASAMRVLFPFSFEVLVNAWVLALAVPVVYTVTNLARRNFGAAMWRGIRVPIDKIPRHARLLERVNSQGEHYVVLFPSRRHDDSEELAALRAAGTTHVWVEIWTPLIFFLLLGFLLAFIVGNLVLGFLTAVLPHA